jgi:hypothetical protein
MFLVVDAINESEHSMEVVNLMFRIANQCQNAFLLVTSTGDLDTQRTRGTSEMLKTEVHTGDVEEDIRLYTDSTLTNDHNLKELSEALKSDIMEAVLSRADGVFVLAHDSCMTMPNWPQVPIRPIPAG